MFKKQKTSQPDDGKDTLIDPIEAKGSNTGSSGEMSKSTSVYVRHLELYPNRERAVLRAAAPGAVLLVDRPGR